MPETSKRLTAKLGAMIEMRFISQDSKIVFVNDGSKDRTWQLIRQYHEENPMIQGINLSRNKWPSKRFAGGLDDSERNTATWRSQWMQIYRMMWTLSTSL